MKKNEKKTKKNETLQKKLRKRSMVSHFNNVFMQHFVYIASSNSGKTIKIGYTSRPIQNSKTMCYRRWNTNRETYHLRAIASFPNYEEAFAFEEMIQKAISKYWAGRKNQEQRKHTPEELYDIEALSIIEQNRYYMTFFVKHRPSLIIGNYQIFENGAYDKIRSTQSTSADYLVKNADLVREYLLPNDFKTATLFGVTLNKKDIEAISTRYLCLQTRKDNSWAINNNSLNFYKLLEMAATSHFRSALRTIQEETLNLIFNERTLDTKHDLV